MLYVFYWLLVGMFSASWFYHSRLGNVNVDWKVLSELALLAFLGPLAYPALAYAETRL